MGPGPGRALGPGPGCGPGSLAAILPYSMRRIQPYCHIMSTNIYKSMGTTDKRDKKGFQQMPYNVCMNK